MCLGWYRPKTCYLDARVTTLIQDALTSLFVLLIVLIAAITCYLPFPLCFCFPDLLLIFYYWKAIGDKFFVVHHLAALYAYYYVLVSALLSNSRTCRQDGKETTKGEQLCPVKLSFFLNKCPWPSPRSHAAPIYCRRGKYAQGKVSKHSVEGNLMGVLKSTLFGLNALSKSGKRRCI